MDEPPAKRPRRDRDTLDHDRDRGTASPHSPRPQTHGGNTRRYEDSNTGNRSNGYTHGQSGRIRERDDDRERDRDRKRRRSPTRSRSPVKDRDREKHDPSRRRDRSRDRDRDRYRERERDRPRDERFKGQNRRDRDRERGGTDYKSRRSRSQSKSRSRSRSRSPPTIRNGTSAPSTHTQKHPPTGPGATSIDRPSNPSSGPRATATPVSLAKSTPSNTSKPDPAKPTKMDIDSKDMKTTTETPAEMDEESLRLQRTMGFTKFRTTKNTKVPGNDIYAVRKEKKTTYRQYMNRVGGFNRPLSPNR